MSETTVVSVIYNPNYVFPRVSVPRQFRDMLPLSDIKEPTKRLSLAIVPGLLGAFVSTSTKPSVDTSHMAGFDEDEEEACGGDLSRTCSSPFSGSSSSPSRGQCYQGAHFVWVFSGPTDLKHDAVGQEAVFEVVELAAPIKVNISKMNGSGKEEDAVPSTSNEIKSINAEKKARVFDFNTIFEETRKAGQARFAEANPGGNLEVESSKLQQEEKISQDSGTVSEEDDDFLPMLPPGFVPDKSVMVGGDGASNAKEKTKVAGDDDDDEDFEDYMGDGIPTVNLIPTACEAKLVHSGKPVSALRFEPNGVRFASGGVDYQVKIFDFQKMDMSLRADKELLPVESHIINDVAFSANGETMLICSSQAQVHLLDRTGKQWAETIRGDQYLVDVNHTKGHTASINCCHFNPIIKDEFMTCGDDGDGKLIAAGCDDGSIQMWKYGNLYVNTTYLVREAHKGPITSIMFSPDSQKILTRGLDDSMKIWSIKNNKKPLLELYDLENAFKSTDCGFSPRGELVYTGTSTPGEDMPGKLLFFNADTFELVYKIEYPGKPRGEEGEEKEVTGFRLKKYLRMRDNQQRPQFRKPADVPIGRSANGRVVASGGSLHSYVAQQIGTMKNKTFIEDRDVRTSILRHAEEAAKHPIYVDLAYKKTQPKPIFQEKTTAPEEEEPDTELQPVFKMPRLRTRFSRYLVLPVAAVIGTIGYFMEKKLVPKSKPVPYLNSSIQEQREKRQSAADPQVEPVPFTLPNSLGVLKPRPVDN
ncbi:hypothetical protein RB195_015451 [Necator americanus]|uniref:WD domain, G-beta repeat protein n=2 Tax=Necator americanus TaxID=51031 RepID=A0ABR1E4V3_NECAM